MHIGSSTIGMESARSYTSTITQSFKFSVTVGRLAVGNQAVNSEGETSGQAGRENTKTLTDRMEEMRARMNGFSVRINTPANIRGIRDEISQFRSVRQQCIDFLFRALFREGVGKRNIFPRENIGAGQANQISYLVPVPTADVWSMEYERTFSYEETEETAFRTRGKVICADGREIDFNLNLLMSRGFQAYYRENYTITGAKFCDPLVINLDGNIAELSDQTFLFDIDADGISDNISRLAAGSGYLALDRNGDGKINDGGELFGTSSGNGFADLALYDSDGNGWIDEGDEIWDKLKIWIMDESGDGRLYSLSEKGLGAICLSHVGTDFTLTDPSNATKGMIRQSGIFLYENGAVGSVQQVDVAKYDYVS